MTNSLESKSQQEILKVIKEINEAWVKGKPEDLKKFFHDEMIIVNSEFQEMGRGKSICVKSYKDFINQVRIDYYNESNFRIDVFGNTGIASYAYEIKYRMNNTDHQDTGRDMFVFIQESGKWLAVWRMIL